MADFEGLFARYDKLFLFDTETTGLLYSRDEIIEFAAVGKYIKIPILVVNAIGSIIWLRLTMIQL